jgi:hypothetical protein
MNDQTNETAQTTTDSDNEERLTVEVPTEIEAGMARKTGGGTTCTCPPGCCC